MDVEYGNGLWVAVAASGANRVMISTDPTCTPVAPATSCWTSVDVGTDVDWYSVAYGNGIFVAVGQGATTKEKLAMTSPDGINWIRRETPATRSANYSPWWLEVEYGNGMFVALANRQPSTVNYNVMTSPDGINWTERSTPSFTGCNASGSGSCNQWSGLAYGNGTWIAVATDETLATGQIMKSTDNGATWSFITGYPRRWQDIIFVNNTFIAMSKQGQNSYSDNFVLVSSDEGTNWSFRKTRTAGSNRLATNGTTVMTIATNGLGIQSDYVDLSTLTTACTSSNCWTDNSSNFSPVPNWTSITYGAGIFLMVNQSGTNRVAYTGATYSPSREFEVVTIDPNDGVTDPSYQSGASTAALILPTLIRNGYTLTGWNTRRDGSGTTYSNGDTYPFSTSASETTTLYAQWAATSTSNSENNSNASNTNTATNANSESLKVTTPTSSKKVVTLPETGSTSNELFLLAVFMLLTGTALVGMKKRAES